MKLVLDDIEICDICGTLYSETDLSIHIDCPFCNLREEIEKIHRHLDAIHSDPAPEIKVDQELLDLVAKSGPGKIIKVEHVPAKPAVFRLLKDIAKEAAEESSDAIGTPLTDILNKKEENENGS